MTSSSWIVRFAMPGAAAPVSSSASGPMRRAPRPAVRLVCFPFAGGGAPAFRALALALASTAPAAPGDRVDVIAMHPPGRGHRLREPAATQAVPLARTAAEALLTLEQDVDLVLYGH